ncbi:MAG: glycosyltransferase family 4 protein [Gallionella sp.]|nr:glycosyltransferase family 4 protein [Gallionella sp.]
MKILLLTRFGQQGASSRMRKLQYLPPLESAEIEYVVSPLFNDEMLLLKYQQGGYSLLDVLSAYWRRIWTLLRAHQFDLVWIEKEALPWFPAWFERGLLRRVPYALDFDDAIFHNYDLHRSAWVRRIYGRRIDCLMAGAHLVIAGNRYLAERAIAAGTRRVEVVPTVVDLARYKAKQVYSVAAKPRIVWIGSPSTVKYLVELAGSFSLLAKRQAYTLRVIGGGELTIPGVEVESLPWSEDTEAALIEECDVGIMPLKDSPWEQGKCGYKLIQYMACGLPTVASPIGANRDVVIDAETGLFADSIHAWVDALATLLSDADLRQRFGQAGRARAETEYSLQQVAPRLITLLKKATD